MTGAPAVDDSDALLCALRANPGALTRAYVVPRRRVMFVSLNKNACTSIKWLIAGIAGEDLAGFEAGLGPFLDDSEAVHNRELWKATPTLDRLPPEIRADIHPDNGWMIFAVVRDPRVRLFSAWQNKMLLEHPGCFWYRGQPWYPRHPITEQSVVEDFARFVEFLERNPEHRVSADAHFRSQVSLLDLESVPYTRIYEISELNEMLRDLRSHLEAGGSTDELHLTRSNATPLPVNSLPFQNGVAQRVQRLYSADFAAFGDHWTSFSPSSGGWTQAALDQAELLAGYGRRIGDLQKSAVRYQTRARTQRKRVTKLRRQVAAAKAESSPVRRLARRLLPARSRRHIRSLTRSA